MSDSYVAALLHERAGYLAAGRKDRARQVAAVLARLGIAVEDEPETTVDTNRDRAEIAVDDDIPELAVEHAPERVVRPRGRPRKVR